MCVFLSKNVCVRTRTSVIRLRLSRHDESNSKLLSFFLSYDFLSGACPYPLLLPHVLLGITLTTRHNFLNVLDFLLPLRDLINSHIISV